MNEELEKILDKLNALAGAIIDTGAATGNILDKIADIQSDIITLDKSK